MNTVFFSYSHADEDLRDQLEKQLAMLKRQDIITTWHDRCIGAGHEIDVAINANIETASIILLLVSPDFIASDYCYNREMNRAMERHAASQAIVIPVILRACDWHHAPFGKLLATPTDGRPVMQWPDRDQAFLEVAKAIRRAASLQSGAKPTPSFPSDTSEIKTPNVLPLIPDEINRVELNPIWSAGNNLPWSSVEFSPTGDRIVAACDRDGVWLWDAHTGDSSAKVSETNLSTGVAVFSPDGSHVLVQPNWYDLTLLNVGNSTVTAKFRGLNASFSPDGNQLVISRHNNALMTDTATGTSIALLNGHEETVRSAAFSPNGRFVVTASNDRTAKVWDAATDFIFHTLKGHQDYVRTATFSPDNLRIVTASEDKSARIWSTRTGEELLTLEGHERWVMNAAFSTDGRLVATASRDGYVRFWNAATGRCLGVIRDSKPVQDVAFSPCGSKVATASQSGLRCFSLLIQAG